MNIFGIEITKADSNGNGYVKRKECHRAHEDLTKYLDGRFNDLNIRIQDLKDTVNGYIDLVKR